MDINGRGETLIRVGMPLSLRVTRKAVPEWMHGPKGMYTMDTEIQIIRRRGRGIQGDMVRVAAR